MVKLRAFGSALESGAGLDSVRLALEEYAPLQPHCASTPARGGLTQDLAPPCIGYYSDHSAAIVERSHRCGSLVALMSLNDPQWGRRPGGNQGPPDLDELMRNFNRKIGALFGRKGGGDGDRPAGRRPGMAQFGGGAGMLLGLVVAVWLASGFYIVDAGQRGVVLRFGKFLEKRPCRGRAGICRIRSRPPRSSTSRRCARSKSATAIPSRARCSKESLMLTDDENIIDIQFAVQYVLKDPRDYLFNNRSPDESVLQAAETAIREIVGKSTMDFVLLRGPRAGHGAARKS